MISGRQALASIEGAIGKVRGEETRLDEALRSASANAARLRQERLDAFKALARVKLDTFRQEGVVGALDAAERRALAILEGRAETLKALTGRRSAALVKIATAEADRDVKAEAVEAALAALDAHRAQVQDSVTALPEHAALRAAIDRARSVAAEADKKAATAGEDLGAKRKPYDADPLFTYLLRRNFGTSAYQAGPFVRFVDRMVARLVGYDEARGNYRMLEQIPLRLREHAQRQAEHIGEAEAALMAFEREKLVDAGIGPLEEVHAEAERRLDAAEQERAKVQTELDAIDAERARMTGNGADPAFAEAVNILSQSDEGTSLPTLYAEARRTRTPEDEAIVARIERIEAAIGDADREVAAIREEARGLVRRRTEIEGVRERFRTTGYDRPEVVFGNDSAISSVLGGLLQGAVQGAILWSTLQGGAGRRPSRSDPNFGGPSMPFPTGGSGGWSLPGTGGDDRGGGDGFRTGGSF